MCVGLVAGVVGAIVLGVLSAFGLVADGVEQRIASTRAGGYVSSIVGSILYHALSESMGGASVGKAICGIRVISESGARVSFKAALIRSVAAYVDMLFFGAIGGSAMKDSATAQRYGDAWAHTRVVYAAGLPVGLLGSPAGGIALGIVTLGAMLTLSTIVNGF